MVKEHPRQMHRPQMGANGDPADGVLDLSAILGRAESKE
jgi:hypothetical protein